MEALHTILYQVEMFVIFLLIGAALVETKILSEASLDTISRLELKLVLPMLIFTNAVNGMTREVLLQSQYIFAGAVAMFALLFILALSMMLIFGVKGDIGRVYCALSMFGNTNFMGIPLILSIFPERGMLYVSCFLIVDQLLLWTVGLKLVTPGRGGFSLKKLVNPATCAITLGVVFVIFNIHLPGMLNVAFGRIAAMSTPLAMLYMGALFACINLKEYFKHIELYGMVLIKMLLFPVALLMILRLLPVHPEVHFTLALFSALPSMSSVAMMAKSVSDEGGNYAGGAVFITTLCSVATMPLVALLLSKI